ncbi:MAG: hypothetical protein J1E06_07010 [Acutalibacter sp.]|nr:hypothetical protein [Acutalibacter sp.]
MAKRKNKVDPKADTARIVRLRNYQEEQEEVYYEYEDEESEGEERLKKMQVPKAVYRVVIILILLVLGLALWMNRDGLSVDNIRSWIKLQFVGAGQGDGFPVSITGSSVFASNFASYGGDALILSDTAFTAVDPSGKEQLSLRHSLSQPAMHTAHGKTLLYNQDSTGYLVLSGTETVVRGTAEREILSGVVSSGGRYALGLHGSDGASELNVYQKDGTLQYTYSFARDYITAIAMNYDGSYGMTCTVRSERGELVSKVTVFDFNDPEPIASYETRDNLILDAAWTESGDLYAVGESALLMAKSTNYDFTEYSYDGRQLTAYRLDQNRAFLSISAYEHAGPCTLLVFRGNNEPVRVESPERIVSLSASGGTVGALVNTEVVFYDYSTGTEQGRIDGGSDAKSIALNSERMAYVLGVSEIRTVEIS